MDQSTVERLVGLKRDEARLNAAEVEAIQRLRAALQPHVPELTRDWYRHWFRRLYHLSSDIWMRGDGQLYWRNSDNAFCRWTPQSGQHARVLEALHRFANDIDDQLRRKGYELEQRQRIVQRANGSHS